MDADHPRIRGEHPRALLVNPPRMGIIPAYAGSTPCGTMILTEDRDHPRIRGEHHRLGCAGDFGRGSSPHTRGARRTRRPADRDPRIIPAYAGSTHPLGSPSKPLPDHPRIRGEHAAPTESDKWDEGSSPHTRGAHNAEPLVRHGQRIIPAYAGSTASSPRRQPCAPDHPRIRGEHVFQPMTKEPCPGSSPHTRGARQRSAHAGDDYGIIPAYAGSTARRPDRRLRHSDHPRIRGEHVLVGVYGAAESGSSPHTRGAPDRGEAGQPGHGIIPAYAGSTPSAREYRGWRSDHPRIRGEHKQVAISVNTFEGSSPHTRGALTAIHGRHRRCRIIPAYAGSTDDMICPITFQTGSSPHTRGALSGGPCPRPRDPDHPRIRGEHIKISVTADTKRGSSPHTRGAHTRRCDRGDTTGIIPAYAGSTPAPSTSPAGTSDHPRIRGEHISPAAAGAWMSGSSPHTRGARCRFARSSGRWRIIPAYAGSTSAAAPGEDGAPDHPRIRGEHRDHRCAAEVRRGSSPHTRGARLRQARPRRDADHPRIRGEHDYAKRAPAGMRIIPAYAGSTTTPSAPPPGCGSSPHTRGALDAEPRPTVVGRIIPAYAGSTRAVVCRWTRDPDHPRIRGEHSLGGAQKPLLAGSSPHTRGARGGYLPRRAARGIIPAYAGSTHPPRRSRRALGDHPRIRGEHCRPSRKS